MIRYEQDVEAARTEYFLPGTAQAEIRLAHARDIRPAITYPTTGMLAALDPDIPPARQRIRFRAQGARVMLLMVCIATSHSAHSAASASRSGSAARVQPPCRGARLGCSARKLSAAKRRRASGT